MDLTYWYTLPVAVVVAAVANGAGIGGATFFSPLFVAVLGLDPKVAIGTALVTEVFGFASGVSAHARARAVDWLIARRLAVVAVPAAVVGSLLAGVVAPGALKLVLGLGLVAVAAAFLLHPDPVVEDAAIKRNVGVVEPSMARSVTTRDGARFDYRLCRAREGQAAAGVGGLFVGLISTGLGELNSYALIRRCRVPSRVAIATGVVVVAVTALAAGVTHLVDFVREGGDAIDTVLSIAVFTVPGVIIGGQLGPRVASRFTEETLVRFLGWLFLAIGMLTLGEAAIR